MNASSTHSLIKHLISNKIYATGSENSLTSQKLLLPENDFHCITCYLNTANPNYSGTPTNIFALALTYQTAAAGVSPLVMVHVALPPLDSSFSSNSLQSNDRKYTCFVIDVHPLF